MIRPLPYEYWKHALSRVNDHPRPLAVAWATARPSAKSPFAICVREPEFAQEGVLTYEHVEIGVRVLPGRDAAERLESGELSARAHFIPPSTDTGHAHWLTTGQDWGVTATLDWPSYHYDVPFPDVVDLPNLDLPLFGQDQPYYPTGRDALNELLYGIARPQKQINPWAHVVIRLPYLRASIRSVSYVEGQGIAVNLEESIPSGASGHELHLAWMYHDTDRRLQREKSAVINPGRHVFRLTADPAYASVALLSESGELRDSAERYRPSEPTASSVALYPTVLADAVDFLASVWKDMFGERLLVLHKTASASALAVPVGTRSDFESRLSSVGAIMKTIAVPDKLLAPADRQKLTAVQTFDRMRSALRATLSEPDLTSGLKAVDMLSHVNDLRNALQHPEDRNLGEALARFNIGLSPRWPEAWDAVRSRLVVALTELREAVQSA